MADDGSADCGSPQSFDRMTRNGADAVSTGRGKQRGPFPAGALVLLSLGNPREKFWGALLDLGPAGVWVRGIDLNSFEDFLALLRAGESVTPGDVFFPMHRVERVERDLRNGDVPSLGERFEKAAGPAAAAMFATTSGRSMPPR